MSSSPSYSHSDVLSNAAISSFKVANCATEPADAEAELAALDAAALADALDAAALAELPDEALDMVSGGCGDEGGGKDDGGKGGVRSHFGL